MGFNGDMSDMHLFMKLAFLTDQFDMIHMFLSENGWVLYVFFCIQWGN